MNHINTTLILVTTNTVSYSYRYIRNTDWRNTLTNTNNTHHVHHNNRPSIVYTLAISLITTLFIISVQHLMLVTKQPTYAQMDEMTNQAQGSFLRNHPPTSRHLDQHLLHQVSGTFFSRTKDDNDDFFSIPSMWHDEFFSPLLDSPFMNEFRRQHKQMMDPVFELNEDDGDLVSLVLSLPDIPVQDVMVDVIGNRIIHIRGEHRNSNSHVSFDKRFALGNHVNESELKAKLNKDGDLVVTAPKVGGDKTTKDEVRRHIPIAEEL